MQSGGNGTRRRGLGFDATPADGAAADGFFDRAEKDDVHQLAIVEALEKDGDEERPVFFFLESKRESAGEHVDKQEAEEEDDGLFDVGGGPELREFSDSKLSETPEQQRAEEHQVDDRGDQRQHELEYKDIRQSDPAERALLGAEE